jgi:hypothetical protein
VACTGPAAAGARFGEFWTDGSSISFRPVTEAKTLTADAFLLPMLADAHAHPSAPVPDDRLDEVVLHAD